MRHIKFIIGRLEIIGGGNALVGGRCCGDEIRCGDHATIMTKSDGAQEIMQRDLRTIFHTIQIYGRDMDSISPGLTAGIIVPDAIAEQMHINWALEGDCDD